jgi:RHS repeat-associated protein
MPRNPHLLLTTLVAILLFTALLLPTRTLAAVEVRNWLIAGAEQVLTYPQPAVKLLNGVTPAAATYLHRDALGSVRAITSAAGAKIEAAVYKPFGEQSEWVTPGNAAPETKGWIGERYDADAGLQYLNARYYDPELGLFLQPDWFEVTKAGVGTNRFSYSFNDPVNLSDPNGNFGAPPSKEMIEKNRLENSRRKPTEYQKFTDWFFGDQKTRNQRHIDNAKTEFKLAQKTYSDSLDPSDEMYQEHIRKGYEEIGAIGKSSTEEAWDLLLGPAVDAALGGAGVGTVTRATLPAKTVFAPPAKTAGDILMPGGTPVGIVEKFARQISTRTVSQAQYDAIKAKLMDIARPAASSKGYPGAQYDLSPAGWMGVRTSGGYGETLDFSIPGLKGIIDKLHWK